MAEAIGMRQSWFQPGGTLDHYDLVKSKRDHALRLGAIFKDAKTAARERIALRQAAWDARQNTEIS